MAIKEFFLSFGNKKERNGRKHWDFRNVHSLKSFFKSQSQDHKNITLKRRLHYCLTQILAGKDFFLSFGNKEETDFLLRNQIFDTFQMCTQVRYTKETEFSSSKDLDSPEDLHNMVHIVIALPSHWDLIPKTVGTTFPAQETVFAFFMNPSLIYSD